MTRTPTKITMSNDRRLDREQIACIPGGDAMLRELDLVVAVGELEYKRTNKTLYNDVLQQRVAERVAPLDSDLAPEFLGVIQVDGHGGALALEAGRRIANMPRGTWAILRSAEGKYDGWMSDGTGSVATPSGEKFTAAHARDPSLTFNALYGVTLGTIIYRQRNTARSAIEAATIASALPPLGVKTAGAYRLDGKEWTSLTSLGPDTEHGPNRWKVKVTKPGCARTYLIEDATFASLLKIDPVMPEQWDDEGNADRLLSLRERRVGAATAAWPAFAEREDLDVSLLTYPTYHDIDNGLEAALYSSASKSHIGTYMVRFTPGTDKIFGLSTSSQPLSRAA